MGTRNKKTKTSEFAVRLRGKSLFLYFNHLPTTVDLNNLGMKKEFTDYIKQEMAQINPQHLSPIQSSTQNYITNNMNL
jgi:hypothetical protein